MVLRVYIQWIPWIHRSIVRSILLRPAAEKPNYLQHKKKRAATASACREPKIIEVVFQFIYLYTPYHHYSLKGLNRHHIYDMSNQQLALITQALACIHFLRKEEEEGGLAVNVA